MIKITVSSTELRHNAGNARATGKPYSMYIQSVWFHTLDKAGNPNPYPEKGEVIVPLNEAKEGIPYAVGEYQLHPSSLYVGRQGGLEVSPKLHPLKAR